MLFGLKPEGFGLHAGSHPLEGISRSSEAEEHFLEPGEPGLEGEEPGLEGEEQGLKAEELFFEQPEPGLQDMRHSLQRTASGVAVAAWQPAQGGGFSFPPFDLARPWAPCLPLDDIERPSFPEIIRFKQLTPPRVVARTCTCCTAYLGSA